MLKDYDEEIKEMLRLGFSVEDISKKLGYSTQNLYKYMKNRSYKCIVKEQELELIREYAKTHTLQECADKFLYKYGSMANKFRKHNIKAVRKFKPRGKNVERDTMIAYLADKFTYESIGKIFGMTRERVRQIYEREKAN